MHIREGDKMKSRWSSCLAVFVILAVASGAVVASGQGNEPRPDAKRKAPTQVTYIVRHGDTVASMSRLFLVSEKALRRANNLPADAEVRPGDRVVIPLDEGLPPAPAPTAATSSATYVVRKGDSIKTIAGLFLVSEAFLRRINGLAPDAEVQPGDHLTIHPE
jgi:LysM repeat protein